MTNIIQFRFNAQEVRTIADDKGEPWFAATDVCAVLGYRNASDAVAKHCREKGIAKRDTLTAKGNQALTFINEGNLYRLIVKSRKPEAEKFEQLVMEEILPTIRKTGAYLTPQTLSEVMEHPEKAARLFHELTLLQDSMEEMRPKAEYYNALVDCNVLTNIRQTAKELHIPERLFTYLLEDMGFAYCK